MKMKYVLLIRVPNSELDDALKQMSSLMKFLDYRNINADCKRKNKRPLRASIL